MGGEGGSETGRLLQVEYCRRFQEAGKDFFSGNVNDVNESAGRLVHIRLHKQQAIMYDEALWATEMLVKRAHGVAR